MEGRKLALRLLICLASTRVLALMLVGVGALRLIAWADLTPPLANVAARQLPELFLWAALAPAIFVLSRRWLLNSPKWRQHLLSHVLLAVVMVVPVPTMHSRVRRAQGQPDRWFVYFVNQVGDNLFLYSFIALQAHADVFRQESQRNRLQAAELSAQLSLARLDALRSQLNPHFLFNTLNSATAFLRSHPGRAEEVLIRLGDLLRTTLAEEEHLVPLEREIELTRSYLAIQEIRLGDRLRTRWAIPDDCLQIGVPTLILQPLVENAIEHQIGNLPGGGQIELSANRKGDLLVLRVHNRGLEGLPVQIEGHGIGLQNCRERLQQIYGSRATLQTTATDDPGFVAELKIPTETGLSPALKGGEG